MKRYKMMLAQVDERHIRVGVAVLALIALVLGGGAPATGGSGG